jgi:DNA-directed RNA polymerase subunit RPC12/RpoP
MTTQLSQDEQTKAALDKAKSKKTEPVNGPEEPKNETPQAEQASLNPNQLFLGDGKVVTVSPWTGKTKKKIKKAFEGLVNIEDLDFKRVIEVLVYNHIKEKSYLSEQEQQYIMGHLKEISISPKIETEVYCPKCSFLWNLKTTVQEAAKFTPSKLPKTFTELQDLDSEITFVEIESKQKLDDEVDKIMNADNYDNLTSEKDIEAAMHLRVKNLETSTVLNTLETIEYLDNLTLKSANKILNGLSQVESKYKMTAEGTCPECSHKDTYDIEIISDIFATMME